MHKLKRYPFIFLSLFLLLLAGCAQDAAAPEESIQEAALETPAFSSSLVAKHSDKCLDVPGGSQERGLLLQQWSCAEGNPNQQFDFHPVAGKADTYIIKNPKSGYVCRYLATPKERG